MRFWQSLDTFDDNTRTWEDFKIEILDYYPGATGTAEVTTEELVQVVETFQKKVISTTQELAEYHREFAVVAKALCTQGTLSEILIAQHYVRPFPESIRARIDTGLYVHYPTKKLRLAPEVFAVGIGRQFPALQSKKRQQLKPKLKIQKIPYSNNSWNCPWDDCPAKVLKECPDLADWVAKGKVERNEQGFVQLKGGRDLPNKTKYKWSLVKTRFECYFEENPSAKTWILDVPQPSGSPLAPVLAGIEVSQHNAYTLHSYQGPSMLATAAAYTLQRENDPSEAAAIRDLIFKMETRRAMKEQSGSNSSSTSPLKPNAPSAGNPQPPTAKPPTDPEPLKLIPPRTTAPTNPPKPIIGKLPENYVPPQERTVGIQPKEDARNYRYRACHVLALNREAVTSSFVPPK
ncbi:hypothetical protein F5051DRAFT_446545 [Lentinula edodes]|nr:hypothetical protein F5051DRAFT_446545 [Lentinula edodes]